MIHHRMDLIECIESILFLSVFYSSYPTITWSQSLYSYFTTLFLSIFQPFYIAGDVQAIEEKHKTNTDMGTHTHARCWVQHIYETDYYILFAK